MAPIGCLITGWADRLFYVFEMSPRRAFGSLPPKGVRFALKQFGDKTP
ncbi:hypothetical protein [Achromobacter sp. UMC46]|nr:hypothetical protein [Achromobacter sp. UMC46]